MHKEQKPTETAVNKSSKTLSVALFDNASFVFAVIFLISFFLNIRYYPTELDTPYHLLMGKIVFLKGILFRWDIFEFAPSGRYMAYPPLLHWIIAGIRSIHNFDFFTIGRIIVSCQVILYLASIWFFSRRFFGPVAAFAALVLTTSVSEFWWWQTSVAPIALMHAFFWIGFFVFLKKKWAWALLWTASSFYLHLGSPYVIFTSLFIFSVWEMGRDKTYLVKTLQLFTVSLLLAVPEFMYFSKGYLAGFSPTQQRSLAPAFFNRVDLNFAINSLNIWFWVIFIIGVWHLLALSRTSKFGEGERAVISCSCVIAFNALFFYGSSRFPAEFPLGSVLIAALGFKYIIMQIERIEFVNKTIVIILAIGLCIILSFGEKIYFLNNSIFFQLAPFGNHINSIAKNAPLLSKHPYRIQDFFWRKDTKDLLGYIEKNIPDEEILHLSNGAVACYITLKTEHKTDWGMFWESLPKDLVKRIEANRAHGYFIFMDNDYEIQLLFGGHPGLFERFKNRILKIGRFCVLHAP